MDTDAARTEWDSYWTAEPSGIRRVYSWIAVLYRLFIIKPALNHYLGRYFSPGDNLLHAGCGGGQVDADVVWRHNITALDISPIALERYRAVNRMVWMVKEGSILDIPADVGKFDGIYNLGVMEHFDSLDIIRILKQFRRVLKPKGKLVLFWPPWYGLPNRVLRVAHYLLNDVFKMNLKLHPDELTPIRSKPQINELLKKSGFRLVAFEFGPRDLCTHVIVVAERG